MEVVMRSLRWVLCALLLLAGCPGDNPPKLEAAIDSLIVQDRSPCTEGEKRCKTITLMMICQGGQYIDSTDCSKKKDANGHACECSVTMGGCQYAGKLCP
jgi:hypothetical protein